MNKKMPKWCEDLIMGYTKDIAKLESYNKRLLAENTKYASEMDELAAEIAAYKSAEVAMDIELNGALLAAKQIGEENEILAAENKRLSEDKIQELLIDDRYGVYEIEYVERLRELLKVSRDKIKAMLDKFGFVE